MAIRSDRLVFFFSSHFFTDTQNNREGGRKEQTNKHRLGFAPSARKGKSLWHFCAALRAFAGYRGRILARNFHKATRNADSSLDCLLCLASIFSLPPSVDCVLLWTAISNRLFSSALLCQLTLSVFSGTFLPSSTSGLVLRPFVWVSRQNKEILWVALTQTETNATQRVTHQPSQNLSKLDEPDTRDTAGEVGTSS